MRKRLVQGIILSSFPDKAFPLLFIFSHGRYVLLLLCQGAKLTHDTINELLGDHTLTVPLHWNLKAIMNRIQRKKREPKEEKKREKKGTIRDSNL